MNYLAAFVASYLYIALKATQQLQVVNFLWLRIMPTSLLMGACEVFIMVNVVRSASSIGGLCVLALCIGTGSGLGCLTAMWWHRRGHAAD